MPLRANSCSIHSVSLAGLLGSDCGQDHLSEIDRVYGKIPAVMRMKARTSADIAAYCTRVCSCQEPNRNSSLVHGNDLFLFSFSFFFFFFLLRVEFTGDRSVPEELSERISGNLEDVLNELALSKEQT